MEVFLKSDRNTWQDMALTGSKQDLVSLYRKYNIRLSWQNRLEDRHQDTTLIKDNGHLLIICRYPYIENGFSPQMDTLSFIIAEGTVLTMHRQPVICNALHKLTASLPAQDITPGRIVTLALEKILEQSSNVINVLNEDLQKALENYKEMEYLPSEEELLRLQICQKETSTALKQLHWLLLQIYQHEDIALDDNSHRDLTAAINYCQSLNSRLEVLQVTLDWVNSTDQKLLTSRNTAAVNRLGTLCSIFLPIIFIAALYSMRFENMSELKSSWGYPMSLGLMTVTALCAWWYNRH